MITARALIERNDKTMRLAHFDPDERPRSIQLYGIDPQVMFTPENTYFKDDRVKQVMGVKLGLKGAVGLAKPGMPADGMIAVPMSRVARGG